MSSSKRLSKEIAASPVLASEAFITLNVGGDKFVVLKDILSQAVFFQSLLSGRWDGNMLQDGSYFIDWDPKIFRHIINFLRSGHLPTCFKGVNEGFDLDFVAELKEAAAYFGVEELHNWLEHKKYFAAITVEHSFHVLDQLHEKGFSTMSFSGDAVVEHHVSWVTKDLRICPRDIPAHNEDPTKCGQLCDSAAAKKGARDMDKKQFATVLVTCKKAVHKADTGKLSKDGCRGKKLMELSLRLPHFRLVFPRKQSLQETNTYETSVSSSVQSSQKCNSTLSFVQKPTCSQR
ncbi:BTB/POZ protein [Phyllosticta capitalensis]|uniref:BTB/POZ protein n=1 Tax=Phyllosticta capitalensis TaxID=121624 RepID=A0ABR1YY14_9PEZI